MRWLCGRKWLKAPYAAIDEKMFTEKFMDLIRGSDA